MRGAGGAVLKGLMAGKAPWATRHVEEGWHIALKEKIIRKCVRMEVEGVKRMKRMMMMVSKKKE